MNKPLEFIEISEEAIKYCNNIRGKNYSGCGSDYDFCKLCRTNASSSDQLNRNRIDINNYIKNKNDIQS